MPDKLEFSDLYKFITSVGLALIVGCFGLPWLFLREPFELTVSNDTLRTLPLDSQAILHQKLRLELFIFGHLTVICSSMLVIGFALFAGGCFGWWSRQKWRDRAENATTKGAEQRLGPMTEPQVEMKATSEVESMEGLNDGIDELSAAHQVRRPSALSSYLELEKRVGDRLTSCFTRTHYVLLNQRLGAAEFDYILQDKRTHRRDLIVELKSRSRPANTSWILDSARRTALNAQAYTTTTRKPALPILLIILPDANGSPDALSERAKQIVGTDPDLREVLVLVLSEADFFAADCKELRSYLAPD